MSRNRHGEDALFPDVKGDGAKYRLTLVADYRLEHRSESSSPLWLVIKREGVAFASSGACAVAAYATGIFCGRLDQLQAMKGKADRANTAKHPSLDREMDGGCLAYLIERLGRLRYCGGPVVVFHRAA
jgi:hypothetical protein